MSKFRSPVDLQRNELRYAVLQNLTSGPSEPPEGLMYYDREKHAAYIWNGTNWIEWSDGSSSGGSEVRQFFLNLPFPRGNDNFAIVRLCENIQVLRIDAAVNSAQTLSFHVLSKTSLEDSGTPVTEEPMLATRAGLSYTRFTNPLVSADKWLVFQTMSLSGDVAMFTMTITCRLMPSSATEF